MSNLKLAVFAATNIGVQVADVFREKEKRIDYLILNDKESPSVQKEIIERASADEVLKYSDLAGSSVTFDLGLLCWWPYILKEDTLSLARQGYLNFHPSYLPHNRGKHPNFWTFVEGTPFGVTIHWVDPTIDGGQIAFQSPIEKTWEDNGGTLYRKGQAAMVELFREHFDEIVSGQIPRINPSEKSRIHYAKELAGASEIDLDRSYLARDLLNLLRARTFEGFPACWFEEDGKKYEVRVKITHAE